MRLQAIALLLLLAPAASTQESPAPESDPARALRLAEDRKALTEQLAAIEQFGHFDEFLACAKELAATPHEKRFLRVGDGSFSDISLNRVVEWNSIPEGGETVRALAFAAVGHPFHAIVDLNRQLRAHGIDFLLVTFPTRVQLYPEYLIDLPPAPGSSVPGAPATPAMEGFRGLCPWNTRFLLALNEAGVEIVDLTTLFASERRTGPEGKDQLYLRDNQHWTPRAAELAAGAVSDRVRRMSWFTEGPAKEAEHFTLRTTRVDFPVPDGEHPDWATPENLPATQVFAKSRASAEPVLPSSPITVLADSYATFFRAQRADFTLQLYRKLGWAIDVVNPNGGAEQAARDALRRRGDNLEGKKVVIWLLSEQNFRLGTMWKPIPMFDDAKPAAEPGKRSQ